MPIEAAPVDFEAKFQRDGLKARRVTPEDAKIMIANPGSWYRVICATKGRSNMYGVAKAIRSQLPLWYGGEWQAIVVSKEVYVRFVGEAKSAAA